ncbi:scavenger receptor class F member 1-like [Littorina saxatilis]|uniref:scavenger receptor class F member 1-like n=1 Tax=Littorina saxatilis TaxID=31220 RepID=UPI0038B5873B
MAATVIKAVVSAAVERLVTKPMENVNVDVSPGGKLQYCDDQHYGRNDDCQDECGHCKNGPACDKNTGHCPSGCQPGWKQPMCQDQCDAGYYGDCSKQCGAGCGEHCTRSANCHTCDVATGQCSCRPRWGPDTTCTDCANGHYNRSSDCSGQCGHCDGGNPCNKDTGYCGRCEPGWKPLLCQEECSDGLYGQDCRGQCGHCSESPKCNKVTGNCTSCQPGFQMPLCQQLCRNGQYGVNCNKTCGQCANNDACNKTNGHCPGSCQGAFKPPLCNSGEYWCMNIAVMVRVCVSGICSTQTDPTFNEERIRLERKLSSLG